MKTDLETLQEYIAGCGIKGFQDLMSTINFEYINELEALKYLKEAQRNFDNWIKHFSETEQRILINFTLMK